MAEVFWFSVLLFVLAAPAVWHFCDLQREYRRDRQGYQNRYPAMPD